MKSVQLVRLLTFFALALIVYGAVQSVQYASSTNHEETPNSSDGLVGADEVASNEETSDEETADEESAKNAEEDAYAPQPLGPDANEADVDPVPNQGRTSLYAGATFLSTLLIGSLFSESIHILLLMAFVTPLLARRHSTNDMTKGRILGFIEANAGIHFSALRDALDLANGVTAHHLQSLESSEKIISWRDGKLRRYASKGTPEDNILKLKTTVVGTRLAVLEVLSNAGSLGLSNKEITSHLGISRQLLHHHITELKRSEYIFPITSRKRSPWAISTLGSKALASSKTSAMSN